MKARERTCKAPDCSNKFTPYTSMIVWCSVDCAYVISQKREDNKARKKAATQKKLDKVERQVFKKRKLAIKPRTKILNEAQAAFNEFIRYRDKDQLCINTGEWVSWDGNDSDAAHYVSRRANGAMRFDLRNVNKSTKKWNNDQETYIHDYRENLIIKLGPERFAKFEADCKYYKINKRTFNKVYLERIKVIFRKKKRVLMKLRGD